MIAIEGYRLRHVERAAIYVSVVGIVEPKPNVERIRRRKTGARIESENLVQPAFVQFYRGFGEYSERKSDQAANDFDRAFELNLVRIIYARPPLRRTVDPCATRVHLRRTTQCRINLQV